jgi:membrane protein implicated in regulation of membrane protease activity
MTPFLRYLVLQLPSWVVVAAGLIVLHWLTGWPAWIVPACTALYVAKDLVMYRFVRDTLRSPPPRLVGVRGRAVEPLAPRGWVRVAGELWRAETRGAPVEAGAEVVVREVHGLTLRVERPEADA